jgi:tetratricopeptide (TPR) repeat protein
MDIIGTYYSTVTGEQDKAAKVYQEQIESYPRDDRSHNRMGLVYATLGQHERALDAFRQSIRLNPDYYSPRGNLANSLLALQQFDEARQTIQQSQARKMDDFVLHNALYALAFLKADSPAMAEQQKWFEGQPDYENFGLGLASDTEAYAGHLGKARELTKRSVESAIRADSKETGAIWRENAALREAAFGNVTEAKQAAADGLKLTPTSQGVGVEAALAYAMAGDTARAESMANDLNKRFPLDTQMQSLWPQRFERKWRWTGRIQLRPLRVCRPLSPLSWEESHSSPTFPASIQPTFAVKRISQRGRVNQPPLSFRKSSTTAASCGTAGRER